MTLAQYLGLISATVSFVWSPLFIWIRRAWPEFLGCAMCLGFWWGVFGSITLRQALDAQVALDGAVVSVGAWLTYLVGRWLDEH